MEADINNLRYAQKTRRIGSGEIGGKAKGFLLAREILLADETHQQFPFIRPLLCFPITFCIAIDVFDAFVADNHLEPFVNAACEQEEEGNYEHVRSAFLKAAFPRQVENELKQLLTTVPFPLAVRSSSLLEDRPGTSFAGKYETTFISNRGSLDVRLERLLQAIKGVYASTYNPNALAYRRKRNLPHRDEKMAILLQEAVGREYQGKFLPLMAGVGFSLNGFSWSSTIRKEDGIVRLVFGLGTRAVGRGYARLFSPGKPLLRPEGTDALDIKRFSQATVDVLDLEKNAFASVHFSELVKNGIESYPHADRLFSLREGTSLYQPVSNHWNPAHEPVLTFDAILNQPWLKLPLPSYIKAIFVALEKGFQTPVDIEFAIRVDEQKDEAHFYLVQARPLSQRESMMPRPIPKDIPREDQLFSAKRNVPSGRIRNIEYIVAVDPDGYQAWPADKRYEVARVIGKVNHHLKGKVFLLVGPGRWGSANPLLGVPTKYSEISNCAMLCEVAKQKAGYTPEVSFGTHFFQDLIEDNIVYLSLYPDEVDVVFNEAFLRRKNSLQEVLATDYDPAFEKLIRVIHIPEVAGGRLATAALNGEMDEALVYVKNSEM